MSDLDVDWEGMVTNIKNCMRDQSEVIKDHISRAINKIEALLRGEGELLRED